ncbi:MarC family protein [Ketogulonicigenium vulgare]|uniref:UPF0056 inner membrane protein n=1 Tax=Ketogulonicigenium vulgare (strain WSH-001) TaxID=759362 RepID=F9Y6V3_KETVW|nr:MarC family protein [Ketogulonicigenium vulgare]ADO42784.1 membrane protein, MarC family [Ketogulonicigenium vulgare Y25]AEM40970.1 multiple antibiotic resistance transporter protein [Ketogulonicigenium vulgare WSH-001]ALJ81121.1 MarC family transcriptional regulator [Ketogulonicigenium vulgare]ANW33871.1 MarC family transcriptional regulator [Ketogulonicigenium vulgare]AOZ54696.1 membrane protein, MarC family [Ketogulonicigenium vulgare]
MLTTAATITAFTTIFVMIDPPGLVPLFLALTHGMTPKQRRTVAIRACIVSAGLMMFFLFLGQAVLDFIGISIPAFRIAGGILLFITALDMLFERRQTRRRTSAEDALDPGHDPSVFPLGIPLIVGPGLITTLILLASTASGPLGLATVVAVALINIAIVFVTFLAAPRIGRFLGTTGLSVMTRLLGMFLAALAVQFIIDGIISAGLTGAAG